MKTVMTAMLLAAVFLISGCGYKEGVVTGDTRASLYFTGNTENASVSVDGGEAFAVEPGRDHQYKIAQGKHNVKVMKNGNVVVNRDIYVGDGVAKEIDIR